MQRRQLICGIACAVLAVLSVFAYTATVSSEAQAKRSAAIRSYGGEQVEVVVASADIGAGTALGKDNCELRTWLVDLLPSSAAATGIEQVDGLVAQVDIKEGEPILLERVGEGSARISVPNGLTAVSVSSDDVLAVGGAIKAGSFVDVFVETTTGSITQIGEQILVLETSAATSEKDGTEITWVTLAVTPESVSELISASTKGTIHMALPGIQASGGDGDE